MTLDEVVEATTITFPRPLSVDKAKEFLAYLVEHADPQTRLFINYDITTIEKMSLRPGIPNENPQKPLYTTVKLYGMLSTSMCPAEPFSLTLFRDTNDETPSFSNFSFERMPGYDTLQEYGSIKQECWKQVRALAEAYFASQN